MADQTVEEAARLLREYHYDLPEERIAQQPVEPRDSSRLLVLHRDTGNREHRIFRDIVDYLRAGDTLVLNNTRVSARRLRGFKTTGAQVEALLLREVQSGVWEALVRPGRRLLVGSQVILEGHLKAEVIACLPRGCACCASKTHRQCTINLWVRYPCRHISGVSCKTRSGIKRCTQRSTALQQPRLPGCTSPQNCSSAFVKWVYVS